MQLRSYQCESNWDMNFGCFCSKWVCCRLVCHKVVSFCTTTTKHCRTLVGLIRSGLPLPYPLFLHLEFSPFSNFTNPNLPLHVLKWISCLPYKPSGWLMASIPLLTFYFDQVTIYMRWWCGESQHQLWMYRGQSSFPLIQAADGWLGLGGKLLWTGDTHRWPGIGWEGERGEREDTHAQTHQT